MMKPADLDLHFYQKRIYYFFKNGNNIAPQQSKLNWLFKSHNELENQIKVTDSPASNLYTHANLIENGQLFH